MSHAVLSSIKEEDEQVEFVEVEQNKESEESDHAAMETLDGIPPPRRLRRNKKQFNLLCGRFAFLKQAKNGIPDLCSNDAMFCILLHEVFYVIFALYFHADLIDFILITMCIVCQFIVEGIACIVPMICNMIVLEPEQQSPRIFNTIAALATGVHTITTLIVFLIFGKLIADLI